MQKTATEVLKEQIEEQKRRMAFQRLSDVPPGTLMDEVCQMLERRIDRLEEQLLLDEALRAEYPALQDLYEKYQLTKRMVVSGE